MEKVINLTNGEIKAEIFRLRQNKDKESVLRVEELRNELTLRMNENHYSDDYRREVVVQNDATESPKVEIKQSVDNKPKEIEYYISSVSNTGMGLWTAFCYGLCNIFGKRSNAYNKKLQKIKDNALEELEDQAQELGADEIVDIRFSLSGLSVIATAKAIKR